MRRESVQAGAAEWTMGLSPSETQCLATGGGSHFVAAQQERALQVPEAARGHEIDRQTVWYDSSTLEEAQASSHTQVSKGPARCGHASVGDFAINQVHEADRSGRESITKLPR